MLISIAGASLGSFLYACSGVAQAWNSSADDMALSNESKSADIERPSDCQVIQTYKELRCWSLTYAVWGILSDFATLATRFRTRLMSGFVKESLLGCSTRSLWRMRQGLSDFSSLWGSG